MARREQLTLYISQNYDKPFKWGEHDCCLFVGKWLAQNGFNAPTEQNIGLYSNKKEAAVRVRALGYKNLRDMVARNLKKLDRARAGDIAYFERANAIGICAGARYSYFVDSTASGLMAVENKHLEFWGI